MKIKHQVCVDFEIPAEMPPLRAVQGDTSRSLQMLLLSGGESWEVPEGVDVLVRYRNAEGGGGVYDSLPDGTPAWSADENVLTVELVPELFAVPGTCQMQVVFMQGQVQLSAFGFEILVEGEVAFEGSAGAYENLTTWLRQNSNPYLIAVKNGFSGTEAQWLETLVGPQGERGEKGDTGAPGRNGTNGINGRDGAPGKDGADGKNGVDGKDGAPGAPGADGAPGRDGVDGQPGKSAYECWLDAGNSGSIEVFLASLKGPKGDTGPGASTAQCYCAIPKTMTVCVDSTVEVFTGNVLSAPNMNLWLGANSNLTTRYYDDRFTITPTEIGTHALAWAIYDGTEMLQDSGVIQVYAYKKAPTRATSVLAIGDDSVASDTMMQALRSSFSNVGITLSLRGTKGCGHEGRNGWTAEKFCTLATDAANGVNPFYQNGFDFAYYMNRQSYSDLSAVVIHLGLHDVLQMDAMAYDSQRILGFYDQMVRSIIAYDSNLKIYIDLPNCPCSDLTVFSQYYGTTQMPWLLKRNLIHFSQDLQAHFAQQENVMVVGVGSVVDPATQMDDAIRPDADGLRTMAQVLFEAIYGTVNGELQTLLNVSRREFTRTEETGIYCTDTRELSTDRCYVSTPSGERSRYMDNGVTYRPINAYAFGATAENTYGDPGMEFPLNVESGRTYSVQYTASGPSSAVFLIVYALNTTQFNYSLLSSSVGAVSKTFTADRNYRYSLLFVPRTSRAETVWSDIVVQEQ